MINQHNTLFLSGSGVKGPVGTPGLQSFGIKGRAGPSGPPGMPGPKVMWTCNQHKESNGADRIPVVVYALSCLCGHRGIVVSVFQVSRVSQAPRGKMALWGSKETLGPKAQMELQDLQDRTDLLDPKVPHLISNEPEI